MRTPSILLASLFVTIILLSACGSDQGTNSYLVEPSAEELYIKKYNVYIDELYEMNERMTEAYLGYHDSAEEGVAADENDYRRQRIGYHMVNGYGLSALDENIEKDPEIEPLDGYVAEAQVQLKAIKEVMDEMKVYEDRGENVEDGYARGAEMHPRFEKHMTAYFEVFEKIDTEMTALQTEMMKADAERYKKEGLLIRYNLILALQSSEDVYAKILELEGAPMNGDDLRRIEESLAAFTAASDAVFAESRDKETIEKEFGRFGQSPLEFWQGYSSEFIKQTKRFIKRYKEYDWQYGYNHQYSGAVGSALAIQEEYDQMISFYNQLVSQPM